MVVSTTVVGAICLQALVCSCHAALLLQADLPAGLEVVEVAKGAAVLRTAGLYEVRLSLVQVPLPAAAEPTAAAAAAGQQQQQGQEQQPQQQAQAEEQPQLRWQWALLDLVLLPAAAKGAVLQPVQVAKLLGDLNHRMCSAADAAVVKAREGPAAEQASGGPPLLACLLADCLRHEQASGMARHGRSHVGAGLMCGAGAAGQLCRRRQHQQCQWCFLLSRPQWHCVQCNQQLVQRPASALSTPWQYACTTCAAASPFCSTCLQRRQAQLLQS
jgi:hypothetical protein